MGIGVGIVLSAITVCFCVGCFQQKRWSSSAADAPAAGGTLSGNLVDLPMVYHGGAFFRQLSWCLDVGALDRETGDLRVLDADGRQVVRASGRLMAAPNGEVLLQNSDAVTWAVLKSPVPSKRHGQLWNFKVCTADGSVYAEVKQRSETKAIVVEMAAAQRRLLTVIGNFSHRVFLRGERCMHVWTGNGVGPVLGAQCEARMESVRHSGAGLTNEPVVTPVRGFYISTTAGVDASLVLAVLLGLQEVQTRLGYAATSVVENAGLAASSMDPMEEDLSPSNGGMEGKRERSSDALRQ